MALVCESLTRQLVLFETGCAMLHVHLSNHSVLAEAKRKLGPQVATRRN